MSCMNLVDQSKPLINTCTNIIVAACPTSLINVFPVCHNVLLVNLLVKQYVALRLHIHSKDMHQRQKIPTAHAGKCASMYALVEENKKRDNVKACCPPSSSIDSTSTKKPPSQEIPERGILDFTLSKGYELFLGNQGQGCKDGKHPTNLQAASLDQKSSECYIPDLVPKFPGVYILEEDFYWTPDADRVCDSFKIIQDYKEATRETVSLEEDELQDMLRVIDDASNKLLHDDKLNSGEAQDTTGEDYAQTANYKDSQPMTATEEVLHVMSQVNSKSEDTDHQDPCPLVCFYCDLILSSPEELHEHQSWHVLTCCTTNERED